MQLATANGCVTIATLSLSGTSNTRRGRYLSRGSRASSSSVFAAISPAMSSNCIEKEECAHRLAGMLRASTANVRAWGKITARAIPVVGGTRSMKRSPFLGECRNMLVAWFARGLLLNLSIETDARVRPAAPRPVFVRRSFLRYRSSRPRPDSAPKKHKQK